MRVAEITEGYVQIWGRKGSQTVRKYRCTSGTRRGRIVAQPSTCTAPVKTSSRQTMKLNKAKSGGKMRIKSRITKKSNAASRKLSRLNTGRRKLKRKSSSGRRRKKI
jgi:hypothetical protein